MLFAAKATRANAARATGLRMLEVFLPSRERMGSTERKEAERHFGSFWC